MARNKHFHPEREPLRHDASLNIIDHKLDGPFSFLNPTQARYQHQYTPKAAADSPGDGDGKNARSQPASSVTFKWRSRDNRKGRHAIAVKPPEKADAGVVYAAPRPTTHWREILHVMWKMLVCYPVWDVSWWVAYIFTWGSVVWVINAFFVFLPDLVPSSTFNDEVLTGGGVSAFIGATIFEVGSVLLMLEAINENREGCFGWAVEEVYEEHFGRGEEGTQLRIRPDKASCTHHHRNKKNFVGKPHAYGTSSSSSEKGSASPEKSWQWLPSMYDLKTHYIHELGFLACSFQMFGATVFWISGFTALPGINNNMSQGLLDGIYWVPQVVGGCGFVISGALFMIETQKHWWQPAFGVLGWHIGFWNLIGGIGFTLSPCFGFDTNHWAQYQAGCSTFWASWAFLIGSVIQWYESLDKNPVEVDKS